MIHIPFCIAHSLLSTTFRRTQPCFCPSVQLHTYADLLNSYSNNISQPGIQVEQSLTCLVQLVLHRPPLLQMLLDYATRPPSSSFLHLSRTTPKVTRVKYPPPPTYLHLHYLCPHIKTLSQSQPTQHNLKTHSPRTQKKKPCTPTRPPPRPRRNHPHPHPRPLPIPSPNHGPPPPDPNPRGARGSHRPARAARARGRSRGAVRFRRGAGGVLLLDARAAAVAAAAAAAAQPFARLLPRQRVVCGRLLRRAVVRARVGAELERVCLG